MSQWNRNRIAKSIKGSTLPKGVEPLFSIGRLQTYHSDFENLVYNILVSNTLWNILSTGRYILYIQALFECCQIEMESSQKGSWYYICCHEGIFFSINKWIFEISMNQRERLFVESWKLNKSVFIRMPKYQWLLLNDLSIYQFTFCVYL